VHTEAPASRHEEFIESTGGHRLLVRSWRPVCAARANLAIVHGFNSHSGYYERLAEFLARGGIATHALDLRGRGRSSGARCFVRRFSEYVDDIDALVATLRARTPALPMFMFGHAAGGIGACLHVLAKPGLLAGLICESIALDAPVHAPRRVLEALALVAPRLPALKLNSKQFSRDHQVIADMNRDPLIRRERQPARTVVELLHASAHLRASLQDIALPLLILHGSADSVTLPSGSEFLHEHAGARDKTLQIFEGYYHDLVNDRGHEHVIERIGEWISARLGSPGERAQIGISYINNGT
jgi:acylglycerol lipase